jgi:hypothetical protein
MAPHWEVAMPLNPQDDAARRLQPDPDTLQHPRGTFAIVLIFGLLFALGWVAVYVFVFLERGAPHS